MISKVKLVTFSCIVMIAMATNAAPVMAQSGEVYLHHVEGLWDEANGYLCTESPVRFFIAFNNTSADFITSFTNGFQVYSPDGAEWGSTTLEVIGADNLIIHFDGGVFADHINTDGIGADTVGFGGFGLFSPGLPPGFNEPVIRISTGINEAGVTGKTICLDSCYYPPGGAWKWISTQALMPSWDGPHCFLFEQPPCEIDDPDGDAIQDCCDNCPFTYNPLQEDDNMNGIGDACEGGPCCYIRGNVDDLIGPGTPIDVSDLTFLVAYLFKGGPGPPCTEQGNVDAILGLGGPTDVNDLTYLVAFFFKGGPNPPPCP